MTLSIIIVNFQANSYLEKCLSFSKLSISCEIIVIENSQHKDTLYNAKLKFPKRTCIKNNQNVGFAAAANQGAKIAKGDYLLFLNPDTVVKEDCIKQMVNFLKKKRDVAVVGCKIRNPDGSLQPSCGKFPTITNIILDRIPIVNKILRTELIRQEGFYAKEQTSDWVSGAFFLVKRDVFLKLGGFDEKYFMYVEDIDFCYRVKRAGYKVYYNPNTEIIHYDMGKSKERREFKAKQMRIGFSIFFKKYKPSWHVFLWKTVLKAESIAR